MLQFKYRYVCDLCREVAVDPYDRPTDSHELCIGPDNKTWDRLYFDPKYDHLRGWYIAYSSRYAKELHFCPKHQVRDSVLVDGKDLADYWPIETPVPAI